MAKKSQIIIGSLMFTIKNFEGLNKDYFVTCQVQDVDESDQYTINIYDISDKGSMKIINTLYVDSCGGMTDSNTLDKISQYVYDFLFNLNEQTIIKSF